MIATTSDYGYFLLLPDSSTHIRLLKVHRKVERGIITCDIHVFPFDQAPCFSAVSYTWGNGDSNGQDEILVNGMRCQVGHNLWCLLHEKARQWTKPEWLWIDAICINQHSTTEKNHQVPLMGTIYRQAILVYVWLGEGTDETDKALDVLERATQEFGSDGLKQYYDEVFGTDHFLLLDVLRSLFRRPYWTRTWIVQEFLLAANIIVCCGSRQIPWDTLYFFSNYRTNIYNAMNMPTPPKAYRPTLGSLAANLGDDRNVRQPTQQATFLSVLLNVYQKCECSDFRDRIYALLSLASDINVKNGFQPDYSLSKLEVLAAVLKCLRDLDTRNKVDKFDGGGYAQGLAERVCKALEINVREFLRDIPAVARVLNEAFRPSGNAMATARIDAYGVYFSDVSIILETTKILNPDGKEGMHFNFMGDDDYIYHGLGTAAIKAGDLVLRIGFEETGLVGFYEGNSFRVTSRCLIPSRSSRWWGPTVKFRVEDCQYLEPSVFVGEALHVVTYQRKDWNGEKDIHMRYCLMSMHQFLDIVFLEQLFREEYLEETF